MVTRDRRLIVIGCKYNAHRVIYFIVTGYKGITKTDIPIYISTLTSFIMLSFTLLLVPLGCLSSLDMLKR